MKLDIGRIYSGKRNTKPVRFVGITVDFEVGSLKGLPPIVVLYQFEFVLKEHVPGPKGGVAGYGQTIEQVLTEDYTIVENLDVLYGNS